MNNIYIIILLLVIIIVIFLLNKNDNFYSLTEDITAKNITASGTITFPGARQAKKQGDGLTVFNDPAFGANWIRGDKNYISGSANIGKDLTVDGTINAKKIISSEGITSSNETIQNIASVYNKGNLAVTNLNVTGTVTFPGATQAKKQGNGLTAFNDTDGANWIRGDQNYISGSAKIDKDLTVDGNTNVKNITSNNITANNITATGTVTFPGAKQAVKQGNGLTAFNDIDGANWIRGDRNYISGDVTIDKNLVVKESIIIDGMELNGTILRQLYKNAGW
jgi:hypothetical protein